METDLSNEPTLNKKLRNKVKLVLFMLKKTLAKTKLLVDLHIKLKNGKLARKAVKTLLLHHNYTTLTCRCTLNNIDTLFISPQEHRLRSTSSKCKSYKDLNDQRGGLLEVSNNGEAAIETSPPIVLTAVNHELNVLDSPLYADTESQVDKAAEAFIEKFYKQLKQQQITCVESPSPNHLWAV